MVPMHAHKQKGAFHEPARPSNRRLAWESGAEDARTPDASRPPGVSEAREAFGVRPIYRRFPSGAGRPAVHGPNASGKRKEAFHEPTVRSPGFSRSGPPEGGTPNKWRPHGPVHRPNARQEWRGGSP